MIYKSVLIISDTHIPYHVPELMDFLKLLKSLENEGEFKESAHDTYGKLKNFFYKGPKNKWQDFLDPGIKNEIETKLSIPIDTDLRKSSLKTKSSIG